MSDDEPVVINLTHEQVQTLITQYEDRVRTLERELAEAREAVRDLPLCGEHQQYGKSHDGECFGCALAAARAEVEQAARWFFDAGFWSEDDGESFDAAWSRYQEEKP